MKALALVALPLIAACSIVALRRPLDVLLPAYAVTVPFGTALRTGVPAPYGSLSSALGLLLLVALLLRLLSQPPSRVGLSGTVPVWLLFLGVVGASALWSISPHLTQSGFLNLGSLILLYGLLAITAVDRESLTRLEWGLVVGGVAAACYGLAQLLLLSGLPTSDEGGPRFGRDLLGANNTAAALLLPLAVALCRAAARGSARTRLAHFAASLLLVCGIVLTGSRGGLLAAAAVVVAAVVALPGSRRALVGFGVVGFVVLTAVLTVNPAGIGTRQASDTTSSGRTDIWRVGLAGCRDYCLKGSGWGTFPRVYELEQPKVPSARTLEQGIAFQPHNIWILLGVESGVLGLFLASAAFVLSLRDSWRLPLDMRGPPFAGLVGTLSAAFFLSNFEYKFFWLVLMYVLLSRNVHRTELLDGAARLPSTEAVAI